MSAVVISNTDNADTNPTGNDYMSNDIVTVVIITIIILIITGTNPMTSIIETAVVIVTDY